jgi:hypothetical protein
MAGGSSAAAAADAFSAKVAKGLSAKPEELRRTELDSAKVMSTKDGEGVGLMYNAATGTYKFYLFRHVQVRGNVPVYGAQLNTLVKNEAGYPVVSASTSLRDLKDFAPTAAATDAVLDEAKARAAIAAYSDAKGSARGIARAYDRIGRAEHVIFAGVEDAEEAPRMAVQFTAESGGTPVTAQARFVADATTGEILHAELLMSPANVGGTVRGMSTVGFRAYDPSDAACDPVVSAPMPYAEVGIVGDPIDYASNTGYYYLTHTGTAPVTVNSPIQGRWFSVTDAATTVESLSTSAVPPTSSANFLHNAANTSEFIRAQTIAYNHANRVRDFLLSYLPSFPGASTTTSFPISVNNTSLGAWACPNATGGTGGINFCRTVPTGKNTAFGGAVYHEFGHAIQFWAGRAYGPFHEGMSDSISTALDETPGWAYGWAANNCSTPARWVNNACTYNALSCTNECGSGEHDCGRLISGIIWDIRQQLKTTHPTDYRDIMNALMFSVIPVSTSGQINPATLHDFLTLDDDDGNLANGTPHRAEICAGFNRHGITDSDCPTITTPCGGTCTPTTFSWSGSYWSGELGTGSVCRETTQTIAGGNCGNLAAGRKLYVNGQQMTCNNQNWSAVPAKVRGGYCITTTPGDYRWAYFQVW